MHMIHVPMDTKITSLASDNADESAKSNTASAESAATSEKDSEALTEKTSDDDAAKDKS